MIIYDLFKCINIIIILMIFNDNNDDNKYLLFIMICIIKLTILFICTLIHFEN